MEQFINVLFYFDDESNRIGKIYPNGYLEIDEDKHNLWITKNKLQTKCKDCIYRPLCYGNSCPYKRIKGESVCPEFSNYIDKILQVII